MSEPKLTEEQQATKDRIQNHMDDVIAVLDNPEYDINEILPALFMVTCGLFRKHGGSRQTYQQMAGSIWTQVNGHKTRVHPKDVQ